MKQSNPNQHKSAILSMVAMILLLAAQTATAGYKASIFGITVSCSSVAADAYYDPNDNTLTVDVAGSASLSIVVTPLAALDWGQYADIYIVGDTANLTVLSIKGTATCVPFVCGNVGYVKTFLLNGGVVGDTDTYGLDFGLGMVSAYSPASISMKKSCATAQVLGYSTAAAATAPTVNGQDLAVPRAKAEKVKASDNAAAQKRALIGRVRTGLEARER
jgi:hypothetical protein